MIEYFKDKFENIHIINNMVESYTTLTEEFDAIRYGVGIYNRSDSAVLRLTGKDVLDFLNRISTNDVSKLEPFHYINTIFTNEKGRMIDRTVLIRLENEFFLVGSKNNEVLLKRWIERYIITEDIVIEDFTKKYAILDIVGPQAESFLTFVCGKQIDELENNKLSKIETEALDFHLLKRKVSSGERLYWIVTKIELAAYIIDYLFDHKSVFDLKMIGESAFDHYRIQNKIPRNPNEINDKFNPHEAGLLADVSFSKGCYIGQEIIARLDTYDKVQKSLRQIKINDLEFKLNLPAEIYDEKNNLVGIITTAIKAEQNSHYDGLCFVRKEFENVSDKIFVKYLEDPNKKINIQILSE